MMVPQPWVLERGKVDSVIECHVRPAAGDTPLGDQHLLTLGSPPPPQKPFGLFNSLFPYQCHEEQDLGKAALM